jgi:putative sugar O-methyltransferase
VGPPARDNEALRVRPAPPKGKQEETVLQDPNFNNMVAEVQGSPPIYRPSSFWDPLNALNEQWLAQYGLERFKRSLPQNYFNWVVTTPSDPQFRAAFRRWLRRPSIRPFLTRMREMDIRGPGDNRRFGPKSKLFYRLFVSMNWELTRTEDRLGLTESLEEPELGSPIEISRAGKRISQDLMSSIRECNAIDRYCTPLSAGHPKIAELGAGYGRLGAVLLGGTGARYFTFDIPPALYVAQWYLTRLFPQRRAFTFRHFDTFEDVRGQLDRCDFGFFTPNQLALFPDGYFDAFVSISTLPEMTLEQISNYLLTMARLAQSGVYLRQWREVANEPDGYHFNYQSLVLPAGWTMCLDRRDEVHPLFQERAWCKTGAGAG